MAKSVNQDIFIHGGGNRGSALAYCLTGQGFSIAVLDQGDISNRVAHANFGLVWLQGKGLGSQQYVDFTFEATRKWPFLAKLLEERSGVNPALGRYQAGSTCRKITKTLRDDREM
jgi:hydrogen cyanide synthase HcnC